MSSQPAGSAHSDLTIDIRPLVATFAGEVQRIAREAVARIVAAPEGQVERVAQAELERLARGTPAERLVALSLEVSTDQFVIRAEAEADLWLVESGFYLRGKFPVLKRDHEHEVDDGL